MRPRATLAIAGILLIGTVVAAGPLDEISHRDKLFDITVRGNDVFIVGYPGLLLHSVDKGQNFEQLDPGTKDVLYAIDMAPDGQGVIVGRAGLVLTSPDGGKSWVRQTTGIKQSLFDVAITAGGKIWAVGHFGQSYTAPMEARAGRPRNMTLLRRRLRAMDPVEFRRPKKRTRGPPKKPGSTQLLLPTTSMAGLSVNSGWCSIPKTAGPAGKDSVAHRAS